MKIRVIPALENNYMYLIIDERTREAAIVDPVNPEKVLDAVSEEGVELKTVLITHHHLDHTGGNELLVEIHSGDLEIYGGDDRIRALTRKVSHDDTLKIGSLTVRCIFTPCHTKGHFCYFVTEGCEPDKAVFTGDTLLSAGCGPFYEGTPKDMYCALIGQLSQLPDETRVYCGHEATVKNLKFALTVEPNNACVQQRLITAKEQRARGEPTIPSTIGMEKKINPYMRVGNINVQKHVGGCSDPILVMGRLRKERDTFKCNL